MLECLEIVVHADTLAYCAHIKNEYTLKQFLTNMEICNKYFSIGPQNIRPLQSLEAINLYYEQVHLIQSNIHRNKVYTQSFQACMICQAA